MVLYVGFIAKNDIDNSIFFSAEPVLEENPKWTALHEVVKEIRQEIADRQIEEASSIKTLIVAEDDRTCYQLRQILDLGSHKYLLMAHKKSVVAASNAKEGFR